MPFHRPPSTHKRHNRDNSKQRQGLFASKLLSVELLYALWPCGEVVHSEIRAAVEAIRQEDQERVARVAVQLLTGGRRIGSGRSSAYGRSEVHEQASGRGLAALYTYLNLCRNQVQTCLICLTSCLRAVKFASPSLVSQRSGHAVGDGLANSVGAASTEELSA